jgi:hypothetical protein
VPVKDLATQRKELRAEVELDKGLYHTQLFEDLVKGLATSRKTLFSKDLKIDERNNVLASRYKLWSDYVASRSKELPEEMEFSDRMKSNLEYSYESFKDRKYNTLLPSKVNEMHMDYAALFKFNPVIDVFFIEQMIHPSRGYLNHLSSGITYEELLSLYQTLIVATYEKLSGQSLLAHHISSLGFWSLLDKQRQGQLAFSDFQAALRMVRFSNIKSTADFSKYFPNQHKNLPADLVTQNNFGFGFETFSDLFVERNL